VKNARYGYDPGQVLFCLACSQMFFCSKRVLATAQLTGTVCLLGASLCPHSCCSAFHSSVVKVPVEASTLASRSPYRDRNRNPSSHFLVSISFPCFGHTSSGFYILQGVTYVRLSSGVLSPICIGDIGIMPQPPWVVNSFLERFYNFIKIQICTCTYQLGSQNDDSRAIRYHPYY